MAKRRAHVKRIFKQNDDGTTIPDVWFDVLRIESVPITFGSTDDGKAGQIINYKFKWNDDPSNPDFSINVNPDETQQQENANPGRKTRKLKIRNPDSPDDDGQTNSLWTIDRARIALPQGDPSGRAGQIVNFVFDNVNAYAFHTDKNGVANAEPPYESEAAGDRKTTVIKVTGNDLNGMEMTNKDGSSKIVDWDTYKQALIDGTKNDSQHLNIAVTDTFKVAFGSDAKTGAQGQIVKYVLTPGNLDFEPSSDPGADTSQALFAFGDAEAKDSNGDPSVIMTDPLQVIVNVSGEAEDFFISGATGNSPTNLNTPFIIYSKDGVKWTKLLDKYFPPDGGYPSIYGGGVWLSLSSSVYRSTDKFKTWTLVNSIFLNNFRWDFIAYGVPKDPQPNGKKVGVFVVAGQDKSNSSKNWAFASSIDKGITWTVDKVIKTDPEDISTYAYNGFNSAGGFVKFFKGVFYICSFGIANNGIPGQFGPGYRGSVKMWKSTNGTTWDDGVEILSDLTNITYGSELAFVNPSEFYGLVWPYGMELVKGKTKDDPDTYIISGTLNAGGNRVFYAQSSDPTFFGGATLIGSASLMTTAYPTSKHSTDNPFINNAGEHNGYYLINNPYFRGGPSAVTGSASVIVIDQEGLYELTSGPWDLYHDPSINPSLFVTLDYSSDQEGVITPDFGQSYFCGGLITVKDTFGTTPIGGVDMSFERHFPESSYFNILQRVAASGYKQPGAPAGSQGTFVYARDFYDTAKGIEVRVSSDGIGFTVVSTPISGRAVLRGNILKGAAPATEKTP